MRLTLFTPSSLMPCLLFMLFCCLPMPASAETPRAVTSQQHGFYYTVQKGDTLWDLSRKFFNSPFTWPGLWEKNKQLPNPHWIYPGQRLQLYLKKDLYQQPAAGSAKSRYTIADASIQPHYYYSRIKQIGFVRRHPLEPSGHIFKEQQNKNMIGQDDIVYLTGNGDAPLTPGTRFYIYRILPPLKETTGNKFLRETIGFQHDITGIVQVTEQHEQYALGKIERAYTNIKINDKLMPFVSWSPRIDLVDSVKGLEGSIISADDQSQIMGDRKIVFIDKGKTDGIKRGQMYSIYYQETARMNPEDEEAIQLAPVDIGTILILRTEQTFATALIIQADKEIHTGARIRSL